MKRKIGHPDSGSCDDLSHVSPRGEARMVNVGAKLSTARSAVAEAWVNVGASIAERLRQTGGIAKGSVLETARIAGIMAAKKTSDLIPMCHPLVLDSIDISAELVGNPSVVEYAEITAENIRSFHFHGDPATFPVTAVIAVPNDHKNATILMGRYQDDRTLQALEPVKVVDELLATVFTVKGFVVAALGLVALATAAVAALVFLLSAQLRRREIDTMLKIGASRWRIATILASEVTFVLVFGMVLAGMLVWITGRFGPEAIRSLLTH